MVLRKGERGRPSPVTAGINARSQSRARPYARGKSGLVLDPNHEFPGGVMLGDVMVPLPPLTGTARGHDDEPMRTA